MSTEYEILDAPRAEAIKMKDGEKLVGVVTDVDSYDSDYSDTAVPVLTITPDDGEPVALFLYGVVLQKEFKKQHIGVGDRVGFKRIGASVKHRPGQQPPILWRVAVFEKGAEHLQADAARAAQPAQEPAPVPVGDARPPAVIAAEAALRAAKENAALIASQPPPVVELPAQPASVPPQYPAAAVQPPESPEILALKLKLAEAQAAAAVAVAPVTTAEGVTIASEPDF